MSRANRLHALENKLQLLKRETAAWRAECAGKASRFALHASQIGAVCSDLDAMHDRIAADILGIGAALDHGALQRQERRILAALQIWDGYRAKWAMRVEPRMAETLNLVDDLAWQAYRPALEAAVASGLLQPDRARLPPLVYPTPRWSPFARPREQGYEIDEGSGAWSLVEDFDDLLRCMPVPLIGIPWTQVAHLAEAVFVGHEVGHLVEEDLDLQAPLADAIRAALTGTEGPAATLSDERLEAWSEHWRSEVFADLWGLLCCGPAYARMLAELLSGADASADRAQPDGAGHWGAYPTRALRLQVLSEGLRRLSDALPTNFEQDARAIDDLARALALPPTMPAFEADVAIVVRAMLDTPLGIFALPGRGPRSIRQVLAFGQPMQAQARIDADSALARKGLAAKDVRVLMSGLALAFLQSPEEFRARDVQRRFEARLSQVRTQGVRAAPELRRAPDTPEQRRRVADAVFDRLDRIVAR
jgi:hypothetical protein